MSIEIIVKVLLIVYAVASIFVIYLLWNNTAGESDLKNIATLLGAVALVLVAAGPYLKTDKKQEISSVILFRDTGTDKLVSGDPMGPYNKDYSSIFNGLEGHGDFSQISYTIIEDDEVLLVQKGILQQLIYNTGNGDWDAETNSLQGVYGSGNKSETKFPTGTPGKLIELKELKEVFSSNKFIMAENALNGQGIQVPKNASIKVIGNENGWTINLENSDFKISIVLAGYGTGGLAGGAWGIFHSDENKINRYRYKHFTIVTMAETKFLKRKVQYIDSYWKWYQNVVASVKHFNWASIDKQLVDYHQRKAVWRPDSMTFRGHRFPL